MKNLLLSATMCVAFPVANFAQSEIPAETITKITEMLAAIECEMDVDEIEVSDEGGYELDDVFCVDGQYDIDLDGDLKITNKRKE